MAMAILDSDEIKKVSEKMKEIGEQTGAHYFSRDAKNILEAPVLVILGTKIASLGLTHCGNCGFSNCDEKTARYTISRSDARLWDVVYSRFLDTREKISLPPLDFHVIRIIEEGHRLLDLEGQIFLTRIEEHSQTLEIGGYFRRILNVKILEKPSRVQCDGIDVTYTLKQEGEYYIIDLDLPETGDKKIKISF